MGRIRKKIDAWSSDSLAKKTSVAIGGVVIACMLIMVIISALLSGTFLTKSISAEFTTIAAKNGVMVQSILDTASNSADDLQHYIEGKYAEYQKTGYSGETEKSVLYDVKLQKMNKEIEDYILNTAWSTVGNSEDIVGIGVFFEPGAFDPGIEDYTIYVSDSDAANETCQSYGDYSDYGSQTYYKPVAESKQMMFTDPYDDQGIKMITASYPILDGDQLQGVIVVDINVDNFSKLESSNESYRSMYVDVLTGDSTFVYDSESSDYVGQKLSDLLSASQYQKIQNGIDTGESFSVSTRKDDGSSVMRFYTPIDAAGQTWWAASALNKTDLYQNMMILVVMMVLISVISIAIIVVLTARMLRKYIKPIEKVVDASSMLKGGNFDFEIATESNDEIGVLSGAFLDASVTLRSIIQDLKDVLNEMAQNNFDISPDVEYPGEFEAIKQSLFAVVSDLTKTLSEINEVSEAVSANADNIAQGAQSISEGATDQAGSVEELQATITNVSEEVQKNADSAKAANEMAQAVGKEIVSSNEDMQQVVNAMDIINESSMQINNIINTINDIANQTNLLALNASIEAARAGETGKGFAVVATQVGELAAQSAEAAKNSNDLIVNTIKAVEEGKKLVDVTATQLVQSAEKTKKLVDDIEEISIASENQAEALKQLLLAADQIAAIVEENTAMAQESSASSEELAAQATRLKELIAVFKLYEEK